MYQPAAFREDRLDAQHDLIRRHPLGWLVVQAADGLLADPVPFVLDAGRGPRGTLCAHLARANPQLAALRDAPECLVIFQGPQAYVSPSWYPSKQAGGKVVPTWNYAAVHVWGKPTPMDDPAWLRRQIGALTGQMESHRAQPWTVEEAPADFVEAMLRAVVGVEIPIDRIEGKWKASQNRPAADRAGVVQGLTADGEMAMARLVEERGG
ncbi:PaiB family negative transcriptional regulator [Cupriavidus gilardii J11]|uniref:PaiB family negative transcriptional regulator n=1 Tax=Cupriavidus gilardii J11 TaxID=936133 RepID=A0A562B9C1_9BURK|nr:FMN-binding negative transcriptional regulator [Cupriavidus gilardii]TWG81786.1 PaiB family negative transcriptional regulator [Cupriavidus gilardii J11]